MARDQLYIWLGANVGRPKNRMTPGRPVSEEMAHRCSLLAEEIRTWPGVSDRSMFGYRAFFRGAMIFAMLPEKRAMESPTAIAYKLHAADGRAAARTSLKTGTDQDRPLCPRPTSRAEGATYRRGQRSLSPFSTNCWRAPRARPRGRKVALVGTDRRSIHGAGNCGARKSFRERGSKRLTSISFH